MHDTGQTIQGRRGLPLGLAFDDAGELVRTVEPPADLADSCPHCQRPYDTWADDQTPAAGIRQEALRELLEFLTADEVDVARIGWRVVLLNWLIHQDKSQKELAQRCKVTEARVSQALKSERAILTRFYRGEMRHDDSPA